MNEPDPKRPKVQAGFRMSPDRLHQLDRINDIEGVGNKTRVLEWCIDHGYGWLREQGDLRADFGDQLIVNYGDDAVLSVHLDLGALQGGKFRVEARVNGEVSDLIGAEVVPAGTEGYHFFLVTSKKSKAFPKLVLDRFHLTDAPGTVADRVRNVPLLPLYGGPGGDRAPKRLVDRRRGQD